MALTWFKVVALGFLTLFFAGAPASFYDYFFTWADLQKNHNLVPWQPNKLREQRMQAEPAFGQICGFFFISQKKKYISKI